MNRRSPSVPRSMRRACVTLLPAFALAVLTTLTGCSAQPDTQTVAATDTPHNVTLTSSQRQHIHLLTIAPGSFHRSIDTSGVVDFDHDRATQVLAPFSGPVSEVLVSQGDQVKQGQPLARVDSPDFAAAAGAYRKALAAAHAADPVFRIDLKDGVVTPSRLEVPANTRFVLELHNLGKSPAEFESHDLRKEKVLAPGTTSTLVIRTLDPGQYDFFDDFHPGAAPSVLVAK